MTVSITKRVTVCAIRNLDHDWSISGRIAWTAYRLVKAATPWFVIWIQF